MKSDSKTRNSREDAARRYALAQRTLKCPDCGSYEVIPKGGYLHYLCCKCVTTGQVLDHFHRDHRGPRDHPVISRRFFAPAVSA